MVSSTFWASLGAAALTSTVCANAVVENQVFVNNTNAVQSYTYTQWLPGVTSMQNAVMGGSVSATLTDLNGNGATLGSQGLSAVYTALVDSAQVQHLASGGLWFAVGQFQSGSITPETSWLTHPQLACARRHARWPDGHPAEVHAQPWRRCVVCQHVHHPTSSRSWRPGAAGLRWSARSAPPAQIGSRFPLSFRLSSRQCAAVFPRGTRKGSRHEVRSRHRRCACCSHRHGFRLADGPTVQFNLSSPGGGTAWNSDGVYSGSGNTYQYIGSQNGSGWSVAYNMIGSDTWAQSLVCWVAASRWTNLVCHADLQPVHPAASTLAR